MKITAPEFKISNALKMINVSKKILATVFSIMCFLNISGVSLSKEKTIVEIGYASDWPPISYGTETNVDGILPRIISRIFQEIPGFQVQGRGLPWERAQFLFESHKIDGLVATPTEKRLRTAKTSKQIAITIPFTAVVRRGSDLGALILKDRSLSLVKNLRYCDVLGNGWADYFYGARQINYDRVPTIEQCLKQLSLNRTDIVIHAKSVIELGIQRLNLKDKLEVIEQEFSESPSFPLIITDNFSEQSDLLRKFDIAVETIRNNDGFQNEQVEDEILSIFRTGDPYYIGAD